MAIHRRPQPKEGRSPGLGKSELLSILQDQGFTSVRPLLRYSTQPLANAGEWQIGNNPKTAPNAGVLCPLLADSGRTRPGYRPKLLNCTTSFPNKNRRIQIHISWPRCPWGWGALVGAVERSLDPENTMANGPVRIEATALGLHFHPSRWYLHHRPTG